MKDVLQSITFKFNHYSWLKWCRTNTLQYQWITFQVAYEEIMTTTSCRKIKVIEGSLKTSIKNYVVFELAFRKSGHQRKTIKVCMHRKLNVNYKKDTTIRFSRTPQKFR